MLDVLLLSPWWSRLHSHWLTESSWVPGNILSGFLLFVHTCWSPLVARAYRRVQNGGEPRMRDLWPHFQGMSPTHRCNTCDCARTIYRKGLFSPLPSEGPRWVPGRRSRNQGAHAAMAVKFKANSTGLSGFVGNMRTRPERVSLPPLRTLPSQLCSTCLGIFH